MCRCSDGDWMDLGPTHEDVVELQQRTLGPVVNEGPVQLAERAWLRITEARADHAHG